MTIAEGFLFGFGFAAGAATFGLIWLLCVLGVIWWFGGFKKE